MTDDQKQAVLLGLAIIRGTAKALLEHDDDAVRPVARAQIRTVDEMVARLEGEWQNESTSAL